MLYTASIPRWLACFGFAVLLPFAAAAEEIANGGWPPAHGGEIVAPEACRPIDFLTTEVTGAGDARRLVVTVAPPVPPAAAHLQPYVYVMQPEYWAIGVVACSGEAGGAVAGSFVTIELLLAGSMGTRGIEVLGASAGLKAHFDLR